jgi:pyrimidine operon attenuation protein / uracil phosphoribosyltransferase
MKADQLPEAERLLTKLRQDLTRHLHDSGRDNPVLIGIRSGGVWVARALSEAMGQREPVGELDIAFYRDDYSRIGLNPEVRPSRLHGDLQDRHVVLVDDILWTGRTVRAALNELFEYGRPASVSLAVLVVRDGHELPVAADAAGACLDLAPGQHLKLRGPDPLRLELIEGAKG